jgi:hypothetical protein
MTAAAPRSAASWVCRHWVAFYTRNLPVTQQQRRREELDSDLFEHAHEARTAGAGAARLNAEILARVLVGVPADLSWRRATRQPQPRLALRGTSMPLPKSTSHRLLYGLSGLIVIYALFLSGVGIMSATWDDEVTSKLLFSGVPTLSAIVLVAGLVIQSKNPRRGLPLIIAGAIGPAIWFWVLPIYAPFTIAVIALAVSVTPRNNAKLAPA